jgi:hypothetical protein
VVWKRREGDGRRERLLRMWKEGCEREDALSCVLRRESLLRRVMRRRDMMKREERA